MTLTVEEFLESYLALKASQILNEKFYGLISSFKRSKWFNVEEKVVTTKTS